MEIKRYILTQAVKTKSNELVPVWDKRVTFEFTKFGCNEIRFEDGYGNVELVECLFDLKTKKLVTGIELNYYPKDEDIEFKKGQSVLVEKSHRKLYEAKIVDIVFEEYDLNVKMGKDFGKHSSLDIFEEKDIKIANDSLYAIKYWKPFYILDNGTTIKWNHELYSKL